MNLADLNDNERALWYLILDRRLVEFSSNDLGQRVRRRFPRVAAVVRALERLVVRGYVIPLPPVEHRGGPGRRPAPRFRINEQRAEATRKARELEAAERAARKRAEDMRRRKPTGRPPGPPRPPVVVTDPPADPLDETLGNFLERCYRPTKLRGRGNGPTSTAEKYRLTLGKFGRHLGRAPTLRDLTDERVGRYLDDCGEGRTPATINTWRKHLVALWTHAAKLGIVRQWPTLQRLIEPERIPRAWTLDEMARLLDACGRLRHLVGDIPAGLFWRALLLVCWDTGERIGAVIRATWGNLDVEAERLLVPAEHRKGRRRDREYRLHPDTLAALHELREVTGSGDRIWPWPYVPSHLWFRFKRVLREAGLPTDRKCMFHRIRRSVASFAEASSPGSATALLDHSSRTVTGAYLDPRIVKSHSALDLVPRPARREEAP